MNRRGSFAYHTIAAAVILAGMATALPTGALAQTSTDAALMRFAVPQGDMAVVLTSLAQQAGRTFSVPAELVRGLRAGPVNGTMTLQDALKRALAGSDLELQTRADGTLTVVRAAAAVVVGAQAALPQIDVQTNVGPSAPGGGATSSAASSLGFAPLASSGVTRSDTPVPQVPRTVTVISGAVLESQHAQDITTALQNVAGLITSPGTGGTPSYGLRGFNAVDQITVNGMRDPQFTNRSMVNVEQIEVVKGPAGVLNGQQAAGGFVNVVLKKPVVDPLRTVTVNYGSYGLVSASTDLGGALNEDKSFTYRLNAETLKASSSFGGYDGKERWLLAPVLAWKSDRVDLLFGYEQYHDRNPRNPYSAAPAVLNAFPTPFRVTPTVTDNPGSNSTSNSRRSYYESEFKLGELSSSSWKFRSRGQYTDRNDRSATYFPLDTDPASLEILQLLGSGGPLRFRDTSLQNDFFGKFSTGPFAHTVLVGVDYRDRVRNLDSYSLPNLGSCSFCTGGPYFLTGGNPLTPLQGPVSSSARSEVSERGVVLQDQLDIGADTHVLASARRALYGVESVTNRFNTATGALTRTIASQSDTKATTYTFGATHQLTESMAPYASWSTGYQPNDLKDRSGNLLPAQQQKQYEVGVKFSLRGDKLSATIDYFHLQLDNAPQLDTVIAGNPTYLTVPGQLSKGVELSLQGELLPGWDLTSTYAYTKATVQNKSGAGPDGSIAFNSPKSNLSLWSTYHFRSGVLKDAGFGVGQYLRGKTYGTSVGIPGYGITNAALYYDGIKNVKLALTVNNVFNRYYFQPTTANFFVPLGAERSALLSATMSF